MQRFFNKINFLFYCAIILLGFSLLFPSLISSLLILIAVISVVLNYKSFFINSRIEKHIILLFLMLYLLNLFGLFYTENLHKALSKIQIKLPLILLPIIFSQLKLSPVFIKRIVYAFILSCITVICISLYNSYLLYKTYNTFDFFFYQGLSLVLKLHPTYFTLFLGAAVLILINEKELNFFNHQAFNKLFKLMLIFIFLTFILLLSARLPILALTVTLVLNTLFFIKWQFNKPIFVLSFFIYVTIIGILINNGVFDKITTRFIDLNIFTDANPNSSLGQKLFEWKSSIKVIKENILIGVGTGDTQDELNKEYLRTGFKIGIENKLNSHNEYLQTTIRHGILGLVILLSCILYPLKNAFKEGNSLFICWSVFTHICFLSESILDTNKGVLYYSFFFSLFYFKLRNNEKNNKLDLI